ncbi:hypothetical protein CEXT_509261 [Caerostris extrusa]|uniref:Uncharacterized protein n=1 Tax=Caerostris extrusa TaxID=172846 RepID=A0AAV4WVT3_CAEEX|nr:hypothetical protein CEXT_509261 [Caerostris extrusa]
MQKTSDSNRILNTHPMSANGLMEIEAIKINTRGREVSDESNKAFQTPLKDSPHRIVFPWTAAFNRIRALEVCVSDDC